jgi:polysaccharide export outer membrane protein
MKLNFTRISPFLIVGVVMAALAFLGPTQGIAQSAAPAASAASPDQTAMPSAPSAADQSYILGPDDVIQVEVLGRSDFNTRARIGQDGTIQLPYLGSVNAANETTPSFADKITKALEAGGYYSKPVLRVEIVSFASRYVTVLGSVTNPGLVPVDRAYHLSDILARVGGVREGGADYVFVRSDKGDGKEYSIKELATGGTEQDPFVAPGEKIYVPKAELFYVSGQVKSPGAFALERGMTLRMAISRAGGLTDLGSLGHIKVTEPDGKVETVTQDTPIKAGDVIVVGERLF